MINPYHFITYISQVGVKEQAQLELALSDDMSQIYVTVLSNAEDPQPQKQTYILTRRTR